MVRGIRLMTLACLWLVPVLIFSMAFTSDWRSVWEGLHVPTWGASFMDLRVITSGVKTQRRGGDPLITNALDVYQRPTNYPRIWLHLFSWLGIKDSNVRTVGVTFCVLYLICISWLIIRSASSLEALILLIAGLSLAPLLAIERGNTDLFVFTLVFLGCATTNKYLKLGAFFCAAMFKVFPFVALVADAARRPVKERRVPIAFACLAAALLAWQWRDLNAIRHATPVSTYLSYGILSLRAQAAYLTWELFAVGCTAAVLIAGTAWLTRPNINEAALQSRSGEMFLIFGGVYAFTFAIGSNWDYRLIFLLPTLPFAMELARSARQRNWGIAYVTTVIVAENSFALGTYQSIPLGDLSTFVVFAMVLMILLQQSWKIFFGRDRSLLAPSCQTTLHESTLGRV